MEKYYVYMFINGEYRKCALLTFDGSVYQLTYGAKYLTLDGAIPIDPINLPLYTKTFVKEDIFTAIKDSSPDHWGKYLLEKKFNRSLSDLEYILANGIDHVGALGFSPDIYDIPMRLHPDGYKAHKFDHISLEVIMNQTEMILANEEDEDKLKDLLNYGPSLGGARPKYSVELNNEPYLAKYSISLDKRREPLIEFACMRLAKDLGLNTPPVMLDKIAGRDVFYIKRFDRHKQEKFHFVSALSLCDWEINGYEEWSYPLFAEALISIGKSAELISEDLTELFKRIAFNIAINNDDDHPRNHGVLQIGDTWRLSPLYDTVSKDVGTNNFRLAMVIGTKRREASKNNLVSACEYFRLEKSEAEKIIENIFSFVEKNWRTYFSSAGLTEKEIKRFEIAMSRKD